MIENSIHSLLEQINDTGAEYPNDRSLAELIVEQCAKTPNNVAAVCNDQSLTFAELDRRSNQFAWFLKSHGVKPNDLVGLCSERNTGTVVSLLAILKTGAGYVPLDPDYPRDRLKFMCEDAQIQTIVTNESLVGLASELAEDVFPIESFEGEINSCDESLCLEEVSVEDSCAYVIYTSGSTGKPKGVKVQHRAVANLLHSVKTLPGIAGDDVVLAMTTLSFDISVLEIFLPLISGAKIAIIDRTTARDGVLLRDAIDQHNVSILQGTPTTWRFVIEAEWKGNPKCKIITGGEPLPRDLIDPLLSRCDQLWNLYGPTETTVWSSRQQVTQSDSRILIGKPIENTRLYIVDENNEQVGIEEEGELLIGGEGVTLGYLNRDELTAEKFFNFSMDGKTVEKVYRTGDLAKFTADGSVECLGRIDGQIKLHGHRIELDEIAAVLAKYPSVKRAATTVREDKPGDKKLVGYLIAEECSSNSPLDASSLRDFAEERLPEYMIPNQFVVVDRFPKTPSGKLDRKALPKPSTERPEIATGFIPPQNKFDSQLAAIWCDVLQLDEVGIDDNFFELGGKSILALRVIRLIHERLNKTITSPEFFDHPTIRGLGRYLSAEPNTNPASSYRRESNLQRDDIAIVGMAARFPGAKNVAEFWTNLVNNKESIRFFSKEELDDTLDPAVVANESYVAARGVVDEAEWFDEQFFGMTPNEAKLIDPQQRICLEVAYHALEDAGCDPTKTTDRIGVWAGSYSSTYYQKNLLANEQLVEAVGEFQLGVYNEKDYIATRIAHKLNLRGPAINVNTACSTSLVAVIEACKSIQFGDCEMAIAGGASIHFPQNSGHTHQTGSIMSPDGHCRPFDSEGAGTLFSDGAGMVVLKKLSAAKRDHDRVYAVIKGCGINNDGGEKASFTAPSVEGQSIAITDAIADSGIRGDDIGYVEAHGTATPIGDPIELAGLQKAFGATESKQFCAIGSVKGNIGHTVAAAGIAGLVKSTLALYHETIPATLHYQKPNSQIDFESSPFFVVDQNLEWKPSEKKRIAGVSSFGVGGTNAHVLLEEASPVATVGDEFNNFPVQLILHSAKRADTLATNCLRLQQQLGFETISDIDLSSLAYTLQIGRTRYDHRGFSVANSKSELGELLTKSKPNRCGQTKLTSPRNEVAFMFPGQGSQYVWMGKNLYDHSAVFRSAMDRCSEILNRYLDRDLRDVLYPRDGNEAKAAEILRSTEFTQPAIFCVGYSLAQLWKHWGITPSNFVGHSIGEFVAACLAGVFSLEDALMLIANRGKMMQALPGGAMLSVKSSADEIEKRLSGKLTIASINSPTLCVVAGPNNEVESLASQLESEGIACRHLHTSHAFHSSMMDPLVEPYRKLVSSIELSAPRLPILSTVTGEWMTDDEATDPRYWAEHMRAPVQFSDAVKKLWTDYPNRILIELGPRKTLVSLAMQHKALFKDEVNVVERVAVPSLTDNVENNAEWYAILHALGQLWLQGIEANWENLYEGTIPEKASLPPYAFQRKRHFVDPPTKVSIERSAVPSTFNSNLNSKSGNEKMPNASTCQLAKSRKSQIADQLAEVFEETSGIEINEFDASMTFLEMGMDSLVLTQAASAVKKSFKAEVTFRQMLEETPSLETLVDYLNDLLPPDQFKDQVEPELKEESRSHDAMGLVNANALSGDSNEPIVSNQPITFSSNAPVQLAALPIDDSKNSPTHAIIQNQLQLMQSQLQLLGAQPGQSIAQVDSQAIAQSTAGPSSETDAPNDSMIENNLGGSQSISDTKSNHVPEKKKVFGAGARVNLHADQLSPNQQKYLDQFIASWNQQTPNSKAYAQRHREYLADPRTVSGFRPNLKEMTYPIVTDRSKGALLWDIDQNQYVDVTCGFGSNFLGHSPDFMVEAISEQLNKGYEIGPQNPLAGEVAKLFCEVTGSERIVFSNTGSEAVCGAVRLARAATGNEKIVMFAGDYHGILDEVIVRGGKNYKSFPAATGIPKSAVDNVVILEYGTDEAYDYIAANLDELACVLVEPVQSRRPEFQPKEFLQKLGKLMEDAEAALIFDEVITGLRIAPGGAQQHFGVKADMATYGKVIGGGMPIGLVAGKAKYMDGLDGGFWQFGDDSKPEVGMTYFAGTFVRHPLALAAAHRILLHIKEIGQAGYDRLNQLTDSMAAQINELCERSEAPIFFASFGSLFKIQFHQELPYGELLFAALRKRGVHIWDHRPCLLTLSHTQEHVETVVQAFGESLRELQEAGFIPGNAETLSEFEFSALAKSNTPPRPEAKIGKDRDGQPGWFVMDRDNPGMYIQVGVPDVN